ncbi:N-acetyl-gamma-glutamyl-phosphate reductase [Dyadobacter sp. CY343]|uniref:N-acetyl-gamma-glutamyl-phosphate reductase n=1 Tax=Dyadobacter sp. CY343 TaxID=2907299 RepID=UPI001F29827F|nr:N-acetyl-gamma-glutamyl-phosphate reductase [Dyadobacter sp. CY343]MCE7061728.1 N-acetyl-gamma-glutamyl-phosphate reductase [Dyadobacter sp. CY343]
MNQNTHKLINSELINSVNVGIIGAAGYTGGELIRILINHPSVTIAFAHSKSQAGKPVHATHTDLLGDTDLVFSGDDTQELLNQPGLNAIFLCSGHGESKKFLAAHSLPETVKVIDLSTDFRDETEGFVYGLPELQRGAIIGANKVANPGCFATSIELAILPLANAGLIKDDIHVSAVTGSTGAGQALSATTHFSWRNNNLSIYKAFTHQHLTEIKMSLGKLQTGFDKAVNFVPYRGDVTRGIMANVYTPFEGTLEEAKSIYKSFYESHPFTHVSDVPIDLKQVINTNKCLLHLEVHDGQLLISSIIDNLTKGASGQAVQNMNIAFRLPEDAGLRLKAPAF